MLPDAIRRRLRRTLWGMVAFLCGFEALLAILTWYYLIPALQAANNADLTQRRQLSAWSELLLVIVLVLLIVGLILLFRVRRFFERPALRHKTKYVDAWSEQANRLRDDG
jgi:H+/Cl- antiporter ClcA